jgi:hypothetical protein
MKNFRIGAPHATFSAGAMHNAMVAIAAMAALLAFSDGAQAQTCPAYTYSFTNGTTADAPEVNSNFTTIRNCANTLLAPLDGPQFTNHSEFGGSLTQTDADTHSLVFIQPQFGGGSLGFQMGSNGVQIEGSNATGIPGLNWNYSWSSKPRRPSDPPVPPVTTGHPTVGGSKNPIKGGASAAFGWGGAYYSR